jgi:hypothetical protein
VMLARKLKSLEDRSSIRRKIKPLPQIPKQSELGGSEDITKGHVVTSSVAQTRSTGGVNGAAADSHPEATSLSAAAVDTRSSTAEADALREHVLLLTEERNQLRRECAQLRADAQRGGTAERFKGMTVPEQAAVLDERVSLKLKLDELTDELTAAKAAAARAVWDLEHDRLYARARSRTILGILRRPLSDADRKRVVDILEDTEDNNASSLLSDEVRSANLAHALIHTHKHLPGTRFQFPLNYLCRQHAHVEHAHGSSLPTPNPTTHQRLPLTPTHSHVRCRLPHARPSCKQSSTLCTKRSRSSLLSSRLPREVPSAHSCSV